MTENWLAYSLGGMKKKIALVGKIILTLLVVANLGFSLFLFVEQGNIYNEVRSLAKSLTTISQNLTTLDQNLGQTVEQIGVREDVALERRNSIKISEANFGEDLLQATYKLGSDLSSVKAVFQDWGDHSQAPQVADVSFSVQGRVLTLEFAPVVNPQTGTAVVVTQAQSATLGKTVEVETTFDLWNRQVTQGEAYSKEPL